MKDILFKIIDKFTKGVETYHNHGSMWLIFTDEKKWVIELTKEGTLWYNFYFFQDCFKYVSLDVVENQHYITEWVESIIQNGVRSTLRKSPYLRVSVESIIQNGVKRTELGGKDRKIHEIKDIVENGIKETHEDVYHHNGRVEGVIKNGIKETNPHLLEIYNPMNFEPEIKEMKRMNEVNIVLEKGIKEVKELPDKSGELRGYGDYYSRQEDRTKPHTQYVNDVISDGIKETKYCELHSLMRADHIIRDGDKIDV